MFDTMTVTKVGGAFCGVWLVYLLGGWLADELFDGPHHHAEAYVIEVAESDGGEADAGPSLAELLASADPADGEGAFRACQACHAVEAGQNGTGPTLYGVVGSEKAAVDGFGYSDTLASMDGNWGPEELDAFIENPRGYAPGTAMSYGGMRKPEDRADLIAYLDSLDDTDTISTYIEANASAGETDESGEGEAEDAAESSE